MDGCCILKATALVTWSSEQGHPGVNSGENGSPVTSDAYRVISVLAGSEMVGGLLVSIIAKMGDFRENPKHGCY